MTQRMVKSVNVVIEHLNDDVVNQSLSSRDLQEINVLLQKGWLVEKTISVQQGLAPHIFILMLP